MSYSAEWSDLVSAFGYGFIDDFNQYKYIVKVRGYTDMQPRTIGGLGEFRKNEDNNKELDKILDGLAKALFDFIMSDSKTDFDEWHKKLGEKFVREFNEITEGHGVDKIEFGKAQKIINVSLKYIYCLKGADKYLDKFQSCHMVLDRYTYSEGFYKKEVIPWYNSKNPKDKIKPSKLTSWSNLEYNEYKTIQENILGYLNESDKYKTKDGVTLTPFEAEFYVFNEYYSN